MKNSINAMKASAGEKQSRIKEVDDLLRMTQYYIDGKPVADKLGSIRFEKSRQKYKSEHDDSLRTFYMAERKLKPYFKDGKLPITVWRRERERLEQEYKDIQTELSPLYADVKKLCKVFDYESCFDPVFEPPESFLQECEAYWNKRSPFCKTVERKIGNTWYTIETVCDGTEPLTAKVKRLIFSDREVAC